MFRIPQFLEARTREDLVRAMLFNNLKHGMEFNYFDISEDRRKKMWVAWFRLEIDRRKFVVEQIRNANKDKG